MVTSFKFGNFALLALKYCVLLVLVLNALLLSGTFITIVVSHFQTVIQKSPLSFQDFIRYFCCGKLALSDQKALAYDPAVQFAQMESVLKQFYTGPTPAEYHIPFDYPPIIHVLMVPFAMMPLQASLLVWVLLSVAAAFIATYFAMPRRNLAGTVTWVLLLAASKVTWRTLSMGQMSWFLFGAAAGYFSAIFAGRKVAAALLLTLLACIKPQYLPFFIMPLLISKNWKAIGYFAAFASATVLITIAVMGFSVVASYPSVLMHVEGNDPYFASMICLKTLLSQFLSGTALKAASAFVFIAGLAATAALWFHAQKGTISQQRFAAAITMPIALLTSPHAHNFDALLLVLSGVLTLETFDPAIVLRVQPVWLRAWTVIAVAYIPLTWLYLEWMTKAPLLQAEGFIINFVALIAIGWLCILTGQTNSAAESQSTSPGHPSG